MNPPNKISLPPFPPLIMDRRLQSSSENNSFNFANSANPMRYSSNSQAASAAQSNITTSSMGHDDINTGLLGKIPSMGSINSIAPNNRVTKTGSKRLRVRRACDRCKKQKTKCDGDQPCLGCSRHGRECIYTQAKEFGEKSSPEYSMTGSSSSFQESPATKLDGSGDGVSKISADYVRYLENKICELERTNSAISHLKFETTMKNSFHKNHYTFSRDKFRVMRRYQNILPTELALTYKDALSDSEFSDLIVPRIQFYGWNMSSNRWLKERKLEPMKQLIDLVNDSDLANWLIDYFMKKINPLFSVIHEKLFYEQYAKFKVDVENNDISQSSRLFSSIVYLIFAISIRYSENDPALPNSLKDKINPELEEELFDSAHDVVTKLTFEWQSYELIQSWVLITIYLRTTGRQNSSYMSLGICIRMAKGMGLNLNIVPEAYSSKPYEHLKLKRIFWLVYTFDKINSFQSGKDYDIDDDDILHDFPDLYNDEVNEDGWLCKLALAMIELARIAGEIMKFNKKNYKINDEFSQRIQDELKHWKSWFDSNHQGYDQLLVDQVTLCYHDIVLSFNNKILFKFIDKGSDFGISSTSEAYQTKTLATHSSEVLKIFQSISKRNQLFIPWWQTLALLFNISLISIFFINSGINNQEESVRVFKNSIEFLQTLQTKAQMAKECVWVLKMLNHICVTRLQSSIKSLTGIGIDHGSDMVNRVRFYQFGKADDGNDDIIEGNEGLDEMDGGSKRKRKGTETPHPNFDDETLTDLNMDSLFSNLKWFDQWVSDFEG